MTLGEYVKKAKEGKGDLSEVMERRKQKKIQELEGLEIDAEIAKARKEILESQTSQQPLQQGQAQNFAQMLFGPRNAAEVKEILESLSEEHIEKLALITSAMNNSQLGAVTHLLRRPETSTKETIELINTIVKMNQPQQATNLENVVKSMADMFKTGVELGKSQTPAPQSQQSQVSILKEYHDTFVKPLFDQLSQKDKSLLDARLKEIEDKIVNPIEYIKHIKSVAGDLGLSPAGKSEIDLRIKEMDERAALDKERLIWEKEKYGEEKASQREIIGTVKEVLQGPIGKAIESLGAGAADRVRGRAGSSAPLPQVTQVTCPACTKTLFADPNAPFTVCPHCGATLQKQLTASPPSSPPASSPPSEASPPVAEPTEATEQ